MKLVAFILSLLTYAFASAQLTTEIQAKRGVFTERLYLRDKWIDGITTNLYSPDSLSDNLLVTAKAVSDYVRIQAGNAIPNQYAATLPANLWMQGSAIIGAHPNFKRTLFAEKPAQMFVTQNGYGMDFQYSDQHRTRDLPVLSYLKIQASGSMHCNRCNQATPLAVLSFREWQAIIAR